ncbi:MAG: MMPL family transporter [Myxococcota bacterium]|jgi:hypothetical protein|nr:MMPL family transporter [Myxococcota bacterium]
MQTNTPPQPVHRGPFYRWVALVLRFRFLSILGIALISALAIYNIATKMRLDNSLETFTTEGSNAKKVLDEFRSEFGRDSVFLVLVEGDVFSEAFLLKLKSMHEALSEMQVELLETENLESDVQDTNAGFDELDDDNGWGDEGGGTIVDEIISLVNFRQTLSSEEGISVGELMDPWPTTQELPKFRQRALADKQIVNKFVDIDGRHTAIMVRTQVLKGKDKILAYDAVRSITKSYQGDDFRIGLGGLSALNTSLNRVMLEDMRTLIILSWFCMAAIMAFLFRHILGIVGPVSIVLLSALWTAGAMAALGLPMTMMSNMLPAFLISVGVGDSVHLQSLYRDLRRDGFKNHQAILQAAALTGKPIFFTTLTTMVGLLSFRFASVVPIQEMGLAGAIGVFAAFVLTLTLLPIFLSLNKSLFGMKTTTKNDFIQKLVVGANVLSAGTKTRRNTVLIVTLLLCGISIFGANRIRVWHNPMSWLPPGNELKETFEKIDKHLTGTSNIQILIESSSPEGMKDIEIIKGLEKLEEHAYAYVDAGTERRIVKDVTSLLTILRETNRALHAGDEAFFSIPQTQRGISDTLFLFENAGPDQLYRMVTNDFQKSQMTLRLEWLEATSYVPFSLYIEDGIKKFLPPQASVKLTGGAYLLINAVSNLIFDLLKSFGAALAFITVIMILLMGNLKLGLISMVPNLLPILFIVGLMGLTNIPIDMANILLASIAIGLAVDDTIHFLYHYKINFRASGDVNDAILQSLNQSGRAIIATSLILTAGFAVYLASSMYHLQRFGALIALTIFFAVSIDLVVGPALLRTFYKDRAKELPEVRSKAA